MRVGGPKGITKFRIGANKITRLGTLPRTGLKHFVMHPSGKYAYLLDRRSAAPHPAVLRVIDVRGDRPRLVRNLLTPEASRYGDLTISPGGRTLYITDSNDRQVDLSRPLHPALKPDTGVHVDELAPRPPAGA